MAKYICSLLLILFGYSFTKAQNVGINTDGSAPHPSAMLDVKHSNKGVLIPRVALTGTADASTIPSPATSLLVYNTATSGTGTSAVTPGYYFWSGSEWLRFNTSSGSGFSTSWLTTGNLGTIDGINFIGTTDNVPFTIKVNNLQSGRIDHILGNTFLGYQVGNVNTTGGFNTISGFQAFFSNTTGRDNSAIGSTALFNNTTGINNTAIGSQTLLDNTMGNNNTAIGYQALLSSTIGNYNTANGYQALMFNTTGNANTASGYQALGSNTTGIANTAYGGSALFDNITGNQNTAIGNGANVGSNNLTNATAIGYSALVNASNTVQIGNISVTDVYFGNSASTILHSFKAAINNDGSAPDASAMLDVKSTNKGVLIPRVTLTGTTDATTIPSPATSLFVYNTASAGTGTSAVTPGYYFWNGSEWLRFNTSSGSGLSNSWLTTGNSGTVDGTNFIGTTDNVPFNIRVNNQKAGRIDASTFNTFFGYQSGNALTSGFANSATGYQALSSVTSGAYNTATGLQALKSNLGGYYNTATGSIALTANTTGNFNTATGVNSLYANTTGIGNTGDGINTLITNVGGNYNTALGYGADVAGSSLTNATAIGNGAIVNASNKIRLGNASVTVIEGQVAYTFPSDARFKYNIKKNVPGLDFIKKLTPVTYQFDGEKLEKYTKTGVLDNSGIRNASYTGNEIVHSGFLAQDVERIAKELGYDFDGVHAPANNKDHYSLAYSQFIMPLVKGMQEQQQMIEDQNKKIEKQDEQIKKMNEQIDELMKAVKDLKSSGK